MLYSLRWLAQSIHSRTNTIQLHVAGIVEMLTIYIYILSSYGSSYDELMMYYAEVSDMRVPLPRDSKDSLQCLASFRRFFQPSP